MNELSLTPLLESYARTPSPGLMEQLVEGYLPLSHAIARRFMGHHLCCSVRRLLECL